MASLSPFWLFDANLVWLVRSLSLVQFFLCQCCSFIACTAWPQIRSLLRSDSGSKLTKEGDDSCEAELESMAAELEEWKSKNRGKELTSVKLVEAKSPFRKASPPAGSSEDESSSELEESDAPSSK